MASTVRMGSDRIEFNDNHDGSCPRTTDTYAVKLDQDRLKVGWIGATGMVLFHADEVRWLWDWIGSRWDFKPEIKVPTKAPPLELLFSGMYPSKAVGKELLMNTSIEFIDGKGKSMMLLTGSEVDLLHNWLDVRRTWKDAAGRRETWKVSHSHGRYCAVYTCAKGKGQVLAGPDGMFESIVYSGVIGTSTTHIGEYESARLAKSAIEEHYKESK